MKLRSMYNRLYNAYQADDFEQPEYNLNSAYQYLVFILLTQRNTDKNAYEVSKQLFSKYPTVEDVNRLSLEELMEEIRPAGLAKQRATAILDISKMVIENYDGDVPLAQELLVKLPRVGQKTASLVLHEYAGLDTFPVDVHITRVMSRVYDFTGMPQALQRWVEYHLAPQLLFEFHTLIITHGRHMCKSRNPECRACPLNDECHYFKMNNTKESEVRW